MTSAAIPYGAGELKRVAQRYWMFGFLLSVFLHVSLVGALQFRWIHTDSKLPTDIPHRTIEFTTPTNPFVYGVVEPPAVPNDRVVHRPKDGVPVPVKEELVPKDQTISSQEDRVLAVSPGQTDAVGGSTDGTLKIDAGTEEDPPPFVAVDKYPDLVSSVLPVYPEEARRAGLEGRVIVRMLVGIDGKVKKAVVEQSTFAIFNDAATDAAMKFVFTPAYNAGGPVKVWVHVPFVFRLK